MFNILMAVYLLGFVISVGRYFLKHPGDYENIPLKEMFGWPYYFVMFLKGKFHELRR